MKFYLIVAKGKHQGLPFRFDIRPVLMGSERQCQLRSQAEGIGPSHCAMVTRERKKVFIRDMGSGSPLSSTTAGTGTRRVGRCTPATDQGRPAGVHHPVPRETAVGNGTWKSGALKCLTSPFHSTKHVVDELELAANGPHAQPDASSAASAILTDSTRSAASSRAGCASPARGTSPPCAITTSTRRRRPSWRTSTRNCTTTSAATNLACCWISKRAANVQQRGDDDRGTQPWLRAQRQHAGRLPAAAGAEADDADLALGDTIPRFTDKPTALMATW